MSSLNISALLGGCFKISLQKALLVLWAQLNEQETLVQKCKIPQAHNARTVDSNVAKPSTYWVRVHEPLPAFRDYDLTVYYEKGDGGDRLLEIEVPRQDQIEGSEVAAIRGGALLRVTFRNRAHTDELNCSYVVPMELVCHFLSELDRLKDDRSEEEIKASHVPVTEEVRQKRLKESQKMMAEREVARLEEEIAGQITPATAELLQ